jgi:hypothetical protein
MNAIIQDIKMQFRKKMTLKESVAVFALVIVVSQVVAATLYAYLSIPVKSLASFAASAIVCSIGVYLYAKKFIPVQDQDDLLSIPPKVVSKQ